MRISPSRPPAEAPITTTLHADSPERASSLVIFAVTPDSLASLVLVLSTATRAFPGCILVACSALERDAVAAALREATALDVAVVEKGRGDPVRARVHVARAGDPIAFGDGRSSEPAEVRQADSATLREALRTFDGYTTLVVLAEERPPLSASDLDAVRDAGGMVVHEQRGVYGCEIPEQPSDIGVAGGELATTLAELLSFEDEPVVAQQRMLQILLGEVRQRAGIDFGQYKTPTIMRRLSRLMTAGGHSSLAEYLGHLRRHPQGYVRLVRTLLINVTEFFRDPQLFEYLRDDIMPVLIERASRNGNELRLWSAGCATGEEAYSLAILVMEALGKRLGEIHVRIFATDLDDEAIAFARHGVYPASAFDGVPHEYVVRYFTERREGFEINKTVRNLTVFGQHDLAQRAPFPRIDLILCRNVLIYFTKELQQRALQIFAFSLHDGGYLVLGKAETTSPLPEYFEPAHRVYKVYRRHGARVLIPPGSIPHGASPGREGMRAALAAEHAGRGSRTLSAALSALPPGGRLTPPYGVRTPSERSPQNDALGNVLTDSAVGIVVVDRHYDIIAINQAARALLNIHTIGVGEDLLHSASGIDSAQLRLAVDTTFGGESREAPQQFEIVDAVNDASRTVLITCRPQQTGGEQAVSVSMVIVDVTEQSARHRAAERRNRELQAHIDEMSTKMDLLTSRQRALLNANDELTTMNVELRTTNEHLLIAAEEATSAAEEIETLNEEMHATNEELETLNEELQATVEELNTTNDELEARSTEYQELATVREQQRQSAEREGERLRLALNGVDGALAIFGDDATPVYASDAYRRYFENGDPAFEADDGSADGSRDPLRRARRGETFADRYRLVYSDGRAVPVVVRAQPYGNNVVTGLVLRIEPAGETAG
jgi:two-component system CheB/CheR fusion protein